MGVRIGVLALQGDVSEHVESFRRALAHLGMEDRGEVKPFREREAIGGLDAIAIPGGESTTISRLIEKRGMREALVSFDGAYFLTCAGMIVASSEVVDGQERVAPLGIMETRVKRNAFGRQRESFEMELRIDGLNEPFHAVFIRAPIALSIGSHAEAIARLPEGIAGVRQGRHLAFAFHPELAGDLRLHVRFLQNLLDREV